MPYTKFCDSATKSAILARLQPQSRLRLQVERFSDKVDGFYVLIYGDDVQKEVNCVESTLKHKPCFKERR